MNLTMFSCLSSVITLNSRWRAFSSRGLTSPRNTLHATSSPRRCSQKHTETAYRPQRPHGRDSYTPNYTTSHPSTSSTSASLSPASPPDNIFALPAEVFSSCLAIVSAVNGRRARGRPCDMDWLPDSLRDPAISRDSFKRSLKTFLFSAYSCI